MVAAANGTAVAITVYYNQPHDYLTQLLIVQLIIVLMASTWRLLRGIAVQLTIVAIFCTFSAMVLYLPTFIAVVWRMASSARRSSSAA